MDAMRQDNFCRSTLPLMLVTRSACEDGAIEAGSRSVMIEWPIIPNPTVGRRQFRSESKRLLNNYQLRLWCRRIPLVMSYDNFVSLFVAIQDDD